MPSSLVLLAVIAAALLVVAGCGDEARRAASSAAPLVVGTTLKTAAAPTASARDAAPAGSASAAPSARSWADGDASVKPSALDADPSAASAYAEVVQALAVCGSPPYVGPGALVTADSPWGRGASGAAVAPPGPTRPCSPSTHAALFAKLGAVHLAKRERSAARSAFFVALALDRRALDGATGDTAALADEARASKAPAIRVGAVTPVGAPVANAVREAVDTHMPALLRCYAVGLSVAPSLSGRLLTTLTIDAAGDARVEVTGDLGDAWVRTCVGRTLASLAFPPGDGATEVRLPFLFSPKQ